MYHKRPHLDFWRNDGMCQFITRARTFGVHSAWKMKRYFTLEYWLDDDWYVGKLKEIPGVFSQGATLEELIENIQDAYQMLLETEVTVRQPGLQEMEIAVNL